MIETDSAVSIRTLRPSDLDQLFDARFRQLGAEWLERQARGEVYIAVAELGGRPVARVGLDCVSHARHGAARLWSAHVEPGFQSRGIGASLCLHLEGIARTHGLHVNRLDVGYDNQRARRLYQLLGYDVCAEA